MGVSWLEVVLHNPNLARPFAEVMTGEDLAPGWPGHAGQRAWSLRSLYVLFWLVPLVTFWLWWRRRDRADVRPALWGPILAVAVAFWATVIGRGDVFHLRVAGYGSLILWPLLLRLLSDRRPSSAVTGSLLAVLLLAPLAGEKLWLLIQADRPHLSMWQRPTARVQVARDQREAIEGLFASLAWDRTSPMLIWPLQPGLHFLMDVPLATAQATLLGGEVRDPGQVVAELDRSQPPICLQGRFWGVWSGVRSIKQIFPDLWAYLRRNYRIEGWVRKPGNEYWILSRVPGGEAAVLALPAQARLADNEQRVSNSAGPVMQPGRQVGQSFRVGPLDLSGIAIRWAVRGPFPVEFPLKVRVWGESDRGFDVPLMLWETAVTIPDAAQLTSVVNLPRVESSANRMVAVTFEIPEPTSMEVRLTWNVPLTDVEYVEFYPEGTALVNGRPIPGDLYFVTY
jgi:hypothetical protein